MLSLAFLFDGNSVNRRLVAAQPPKNLSQLAQHSYSGQFWIPWNAPSPCHRSEFRSESHVFYTFQPNAQRKPSLTETAKLPATSWVVSSQSKTNAASSQSKEKSQCTDWREEETGHGTSSAVVAKPKLFFADVGFAIAFDLSSTSPTFIDRRSVNITAKHFGSRVRFLYLRIHKISPRINDELRT